MPRLERLLEAVQRVGFAHDTNSRVAGEFLSELGLAAPACNDDRKMWMGLAKPGRNLVPVLVRQPDVDDEPGDVRVIDLDEGLRRRTCLLSR